MRDNRAVKTIIDLIKFYGLVIYYIGLRVYYVYLHIKLYFLKAAGAALIEAVEILYCVKSLSNENRVIFAACIAVAIYISALVMYIGA